MRKTKSLALLALGSAFVLSTTAAYAGWGHGHRWQPRFRHHVDNLPTFLQRDLDDTAQDSGAPGTMWAGTGISAHNFVVKHDDDAGIELAIKAHLRYGGTDYAPTYIDSKGLVHIEVPTGAFVPEPSYGPIAKWNFAYSYDVGVNPSNPTLDWYRGWLLIDSDPSPATDYVSLQLFRVTSSPTAQDSGFGWKLGGTPAIVDDEGTPQVTQNSQNIGFGYAPDSYETAGFPEGQFDVVMILYKKHSWKLTKLHVVFDVVDMP